MRLGLVAHPKKPLARTLAKEVIKGTISLVNEGGDLELVVEKGLTLGKVAKKNVHERIEDMSIDILVCIGGDGTLLRAMRLTKAPILGLNAGSLGFLMEPYPTNINALLRDLIERRFFVEERSKLRTTLNGLRLPDAVNDAVVMTGTPSKIQDLVISIDGEQSLLIRADGVIISTPTGSTSYALSAGGTILDPRLEAFELVPLAPFRVNIRPLTVPDKCIIELKVANIDRNAIITIDGDYKKRITHKDRLTFTRSEFKARFVRLKDGFYSRLNEKIINYVHNRRENLI